MSRRTSNGSGTIPLVGVAMVVAVAIVGLLGWEFIVWFYELPKALLPTPRQCLLAANDNRTALLRGIYSTGVAAVAGLATAVAIGSLIAVIFSQSRRMRLALFPYVVLLQTVPIVAIAPLLIIWSGYTLRTVVMATVIVCLFPIINSVTVGLMSVDREMSDMFRIYGAGRIKRLWRLQIPSAVGHLVLGAKTSSGLAVVGAIVAEFFVGNGTDYDGLGTLMTKWQGLSKTDAIIGAIFASTILGLVLFGFVQFLSVTLLSRWSQQSNENAGIRNTDW
jgi:NitT/TauT family transport system permease protein